MKPKSFSVLLFLFLAFASENVNAQILDLSTYPFIKAYPTFNITSQNDGMGLLEFARIDPLRDGFINPAKLDLMKNNVGFISVTNVMLSNNSSYSQFDSSSWYSSSEANEMSSYFLTIPTGGIYRFGPIIIGGTINYQRSSVSNSRVRRGTVSTWTSYYEYKSKDWSEGIPLQLAAAYFINENITFGLGFDYYQFKGYSNSSSNSSDSPSDSFSSSVNTKFDGLFYRGGFKIKCDEANTIYILAMNYKNTEKYMENNEKGWLAQVDYTRTMNESLNLSARFTFDKKKLNETDGTGIQVGIGSNYSLDKVSLAGEFIFEPAWLVYEYKPEPRYPLFTAKDENKLINWRVRLGTEVKLMEWLLWRAGFEYSKFRDEYKHKASNPSSEQTNNPLASTGISSLTTGLQVSVVDYEIIYNFIMRNQVLAKLYTPITNRLNIIYKF